MAAARVAWRIGRIYPAVGALAADELHDLQVGWKRDQDVSFARWLKSQQKDATGVDGSWPYRPHPDEEPAPTGELVEAPLW